MFKRNSQKGIVKKESPYSKYQYQGKTWINSKPTQLSLFGANISDGNAGLN